MGERSLLATTAAMCAQAVYAQGRYGDAWSWCRASERSTEPGDVTSDIIRRSVDAKLLARRGRGEEAEAEMHAVLALVERTDAPNDAADALSELAEVLDLAGRSAQAREASARSRCTLAGTVSARRAEAALRSRQPDDTEVQCAPSSTLRP